MWDRYCDVLQTHVGPLPPLRLIRPLCWFNPSSRSSKCMYSASEPVAWMRDSLTLALLMPRANESDMGRRRGVLRAGKLPKNTFFPGRRFPPTSTTVVWVSRSTAASEPVWTRVFRPRLRAACAEFFAVSYETLLVGALYTAWIFTRKIRSLDHGRGAEPPLERRRLSALRGVEAGQRVGRDAGRAEVEADEPGVSTSGASTPGVSHRP